MGGEEGGAEISEKSHLFGLDSAIFGSGKPTGSKNELDPPKSFPESFGAPLLCVEKFSTTPLKNLILGVQKILSDTILVKKLFYHFLSWQMVFPREV